MSLRLRPATDARPTRAPATLVNGEGAFALEIAVEYLAPKQWRVFPGIPGT